MAPVGPDVVLAHIGDHRLGVLLLDLERRDEGVLGVNRDARRLFANPDADHVSHAPVPWFAGVGR